MRMVLCYMCIISLLFQLSPAHAGSKNPPQTGPMTPKVSSGESKKRCNTKNCIQQPKKTLQKTFYHLHQAIGHLESWRALKMLNKKRCAGSLNDSKRHFGKAQQILKKHKINPFSTWNKQYKKAFVTANQVQVSQLEYLRIQLHHLGEKLKLKHNILWRKEFFDCRSSSRPTQHDKFRSK